MKPAPIPAEEARRLRALRQTGLLDSLPEPAWDDLARLASYVCGTPISLVSFIDEDRQWFKARVGMPVAETPRDLAFCAHAILQDDVFEVPDARKDERFSDNPLVTGEPKIRFYAGAPIVTADGDALGTVCVIDRTARELTSDQRSALAALARQASLLVETAMRRDELARWTALIESTIESSADALCCVDVESKVIISNRRFAELFGLGPDDVRRGAINPMLGKALARVKDPQRYREILALQAQAPRDDRHDIVELVDGRVIERDSRPQLIGAEVVGRVNSFRDITQRRQMERMKDEFISTVSHELRTPLTAIRGALGIIEGGVAGPLPLPAVEFVTLARQNSDRLIRLVNDILDLDKLQSGQLELHREELDAAGLAREAARGVAPVAEAAKVALDASGPAGLRLFADRDRVTQVLTNLLANAVKFSPAGASVQVRVEPQSRAVRFEVRDSGPGIDPAQQGRLFQRFHQVDQSDRRSKGGSGLGLAVSKAIVEQHGGRIGVESEPGKGSTFWFELPVRAPRTRTPEAPRPAAPQPVEPGPFPRKRVLLVDDDAGFRRVVAAQLRAAGLDTQEAGGGDEALRLIRAQPPDLLVLDVAMPSMDGYQVVEALRAGVERPVPVLVYSARELGAGERARLTVGETRFLTKSLVAAKDFVASVQQLLDQRACLDQGLVRSHP